LLLSKGPAHEPRPPAVMGERLAARARRQRVLERAKAKQARIERAASPVPPTFEAVEIAVPTPVLLSPYDELRIAKWIRDRLIDWPPGSCWHCRRPIAFSQPWTLVANGEVASRFHQACHAEWLEQQESAARGAMGLLAIGACTP
jgi:hypothetical protein